MTQSSSSGGGAQSGPGEFSTDFAGPGAGGLEGLRNMVEGANPVNLDEVSQGWTAVHKELLAAQEDLQTHTLAALGHWQGDAADGFAARADQLYQSLGSGAAYAFNTSSGVSTAAEALRSAVQKMPRVPSGWDRFTRKFTTEDGEGAFKGDLANGMTLDAAIAKDGSKLSLIEERHQQAVAVMQELEASYNSAAKMIGVPPMDDVGGQKIIQPPAPVKHNPVTGIDGGAVSDPRSGVGARLVKSGPTDGARPQSVLDPAVGGTSTKVSGAGAEEGVSGGELIPKSPEPPGTTLSGVSDGIGSPGSGVATGPGGSGAGAGPGMGTGEPSGGQGPGTVGGVAGGLGEGEPIGSQGDKSADTVPGGIGLGVAKGSGRAGTAGGGHTGRVGEIEGNGVVGGEAPSSLGVSGEGGLEGAGDGIPNGSDRSGIGEGFEQNSSEQRHSDSGAAGTEEGGMGMGGMSGAHGNSKKRKRRARAQYLIEDEETWENEKRVNPVVIT